MEQLSNDRAYIYTRVSSKLQEDQIKQRFSVCRRFCKELNLKIDAEYFDIGPSDSELLPSFDVLLKSLSIGETKIVVVDRLASLARCPDTLKALQKRIADCDGDLLVANLGPANSKGMEQAISIELTRQQLEALVEG